MKASSKHFKWLKRKTQIPFICWSFWIIFSFTFCSMSFTLVISLFIFSSLRFILASCSFNFYFLSFNFVIYSLIFSSMTWFLVLSSFNICANCSRFANFSSIFWAWSYNFTILVLVYSFIWLYYSFICLIFSCNCSCISLTWYINELYSGKYYFGMISSILFLNLLYRSSHFASR